MSFQKAVNSNPPVGVEGGFASAGTHHSVVSGTMQFVAGDLGVTIGRFAYASLASGKVQNAKPADTNNYSVGFVTRDSNIAVITDWQGQSSMVVPKGLEITLHDRADVYVKTTTDATVGQKVFAVDADGTIATGTAGATVAGATETNFVVATIGAVGSLIKITAQ